MRELGEELQANLGGTYTLERELGGGGMSRTYVAHETSLGRRVVVKVLSPELAAGVSVERFRREIQLAATLQHPHVVPVLATGEAAGLPWFSMPYVEGESLRVRLGRGPLRIVEATAILKDVARALEFAHSHGVVHRDIKPDNILLAGSSATVTDFGIAKALTAARDESAAATHGGALTMTGTSIGTPMYMAPEQAAGDPSVDQRSDIYSFGIVAYEVLTGRPPFEATTPVKLLNAHFNEKPRDVRELRADAPAALAELVMRCLEKSPDARPQSASDVVRVLETVTSSGAVDAAPVLLQAPMKLGRALAAWAGATIAVALTAWAATNTIGLPDWVFPGSLGVMLAGLPAIGITWYVQRTARRLYTATPTFTPGGTPSMQSTMATLAIKASPHVSWRRTWMGGAIAVGTFAVLVIGFMVLRALGIGPAGSLIGAGKLAAEERLIITDFKSPASDSTLGLTITEALRADLAESSALRVVPRLSINETLRLMQRPVTTVIDFEVAREIATRDGVKAVLDGNVVALGGRYVVSTRLLAAQSGEELATFRAEASSQNDLIPAVGRLAKDLRAKVGESLKLVREANALERVTTGSMDALSKYAAALTMLDQTGDYTRVVPLLEQAVTIDSTFAMAWRRLAMHLASLGQLERARVAVTQAYRFRERLSPVERHLTEGSYFTYGPETDDERALESYEAALAIDSLNLVALNNAAVLLVRRRDNAKASRYAIRAAGQDAGAPNPITWGNAVVFSVAAGLNSVVDSLIAAWTKRAPNQPNVLLVQVRTVAFGRRDYEAGDSLYTELRTRVGGSRSVLESAMNDQALIQLTRGRITAGLQLRAQLRARQADRGRLDAPSRAGIDSVGVIALVRENPSLAREILGRSLKRIGPDLPIIERPYADALLAASLVRDAELAKQLRDEYQRILVADGKALDRPAMESYADALVSLAADKFDDALVKLADADAKLLQCTECLAVSRFRAFDRLNRPDSAIAAGEAYLAIQRPGDINSHALFRAGVLQRLGELYEAKGMPDKALAHYQNFLNLWKDADPDLQPRVRDVRARVERLRRRNG
jgi:tRNA A-37 threonylcarbamoyl transferase component Bud32/tetratricopeptide (TPR) repeat protein